MTDTTARLVPKSQRAWDNFRRQVAELGGVVLEPNWLGNGVPHRCRCINTHECRPRPNRVQQGEGLCRVCVGRDPAAAWDNFCRRVAELGGMVLEPKWLGVGRTHRCLCVNGHECRPAPNHVRQGGGICKICARNDPVTARDNFYKRVAGLGGTVLELTWLGTAEPHRCRCINGHECNPRPADVSQGHGICRVCARNDPATAWENFRRRVAELGGIVLELEWLGALTPHACLCVHGHECRPRPGCVKQGQGICRSCAGWDQDVIYVVRNLTTNCVKFGITSRDERVRLSYHRSRGFTEVIRLEASLPPGLAVHIENKIMAALKMAGEKSVQGREYFSDDNIALILNEINIWMPGG